MTSEPAPLWRPMVVLPDLVVSQAVEAGVAALAPADDHRVRSVATAHPRFGTFMGRFRDAFGQAVSPSVILLAPSGSDTFRTVEAIASLRDAVALSVTPIAWAEELLAPHQHRTLYTDPFSFYPWMLDRDFEYLQASTPLLLGIHDVDAFHGQATPAVPSAQIGWTRLDEQLLGTLLTAWRRRYAKTNATWADVALFRSLNMAQQASRAPAGRDATLYDLGRQISLWVSAFEILAHTGRGGRSDLGKVVDLIEKAPWRAQALRRRRYEILRDRKGKARRGALAPKIYRTLYDLRNDFLHGNEIRRSSLLHRTTNKPWSAYAPPLYRIALAAFLNPPPASPPPMPTDPVALGGVIAAQLADEHRTFEKALVTAVGGWR